MGWVLYVEHFINKDRRVAPEDKLRLARLMQESGEVVAMTGDAVNDAAATQAGGHRRRDGQRLGGVQAAAKIVLTDDFATLVRAVGSAVKLGMLQRQLDTASLTGDQWLLVIGLSLQAPAIVAIDKYVRLVRQRRSDPEVSARSDLAVGA